jgi:predicted butyrate kinase (DUF1464 family)
MPRVLGIDPGTVSIDLCALDNGRLVLDESLPTVDALRDPALLVARLEAAGPFDLIAGPSGYGLPCIAASALTDVDLRLAFLAADGESGGIGGLRGLVRAIARAGLPMVLTPGVIHLASVPAYRKVNRVDMGTADKVCAAALAVREQADRRRCALADTSFVMLELGGAFTAAIAVQYGRIVDGVGGSSGPIGLRGAGALDGEVAFLAGRVSKSMIFTGGVATITGDTAAFSPTRASPEHQRARDAYIEAGIKAIASLGVSAPAAREVILSGRVAAEPGVRDELVSRISATLGALPVEILGGLAAPGRQAAQGAAVLADGLVGGSHAELVDTLGIRDASGTVLDHLYVISQEQARKTLGIPNWPATS